MPASEARIRASKANSLKSKGPSTPEGKNRSRANAVKHGLCSEVVGIEDPEAVRARAEALAGPLPAAGTFEGWLAGQIATISLQIERAQGQLQQAALGDAHFPRCQGLVWDDDRRLEGHDPRRGQLPGQPDLVVERLRQTPQGCQWLITRWAMLAHFADKPGGWTAEQSSLAFNLLGTPSEFRTGVEPGTTIDLDGKLDGPVEGQAVMARRLIADLEHQSELVKELDESDRKRAETGLSDDAELRRLRRYEADLQRRFRWMVQMLQGTNANDKQQPPSSPRPEPKPEPSQAKTEPPPTAGASNPPTPMTRSAARAEKKLMKAEARREARMRKLDNRRA